ncbi:sensor histidine kinase [Streptomyces avermitilis]|uniref:sensor histidine kinase n=1 Tax=Streptomyces avermitilis TaxID=33903 RepID=UPI0033B2D650
MHDAVPDPVPKTAPGRRPGPRNQLLTHTVFVLVSIGAVVRLAAVKSPLCLYTLSLSVLLAVCYAGGLALWDRLGRWRSAWLGALLLLWLLLLHTAPASVAPAYSWYAVPFACLALRVLRGPLSVGTVAAITALLVVVLLRKCGVSEPDLAIAPAAAVLGTAALYRAQQRDAAVRQRLLDELRSTRGELARRQREAGRLAERARIAHEIHDTLAQELSGSRMLLQAAERDRRRSPEMAWDTVRAVTESLGENLAETRRIISGLTPSALDNDDLETALAALCSRAEQSGCLPQVSFRVVGDRCPLPEETAAALLRVTQGALANVRDHARAGSVLINLVRLNDRVSLEVRDDGIGFDPDRTAAAPGRGYGLGAIRERLRLCGGTLTVDSAPGRGTALTADVPLRHVEPQPGKPHAAPRRAPAEAVAG